MEKRLRKAALAAGGLFALTAAAYGLGHRTLCQGFLPENDMKIPVSDAAIASVERDRYDAVLDRVQEVYGPIIAAKGGTLVINRLWENATVNASAQQSGGEYIINMYGGLARHPAVTYEGFALVACHEIGHHLGGYPKMWGWATNEGGADYFATLKCLRLVLGGGGPAGAVDPGAARDCAWRFPDPAARARCENNSLGGQSVAFLFQALRNSSTPPRFGTPDQNAVDEMLNAHPATQCRLDTYFAGAMCTAPLGQDVANDDPTAGACTLKGRYAAGLRPRCWYKPPADEPDMVAPPANLARPELPDAGAFGRRVEALGQTLSGRGV